MQNFKVHKNRLYFTFLWSWIKDKQIVHRGDLDSGVIIVYDEEGRMVGMWGYESIESNEKE